MISIIDTQIIPIEFSPEGSKHVRVLLKKWVTVERIPLDRMQNEDTCFLLKGFQVLNYQL